MARLPDPIKEIDGTKETLKLQVRISALWVLTNRDSQLEMVVMDRMGDKIHVVVRKDEFKKWHQTLKEGSTYMIHNFRVVPNEGQYKACDHPFKLLFMSGTIVREVDLPNFPINRYNFKDFRDILSGNFNPTLLVDIIGAVHEITYQGLRNSPKKIVLNLKSDSGDILNCTLWEDYALKLVDFLNQTQHAGLIILVLTRAKIKEAQGVYPLSISNSFHGSKLLLNEDIPKIQTFKERIAGSMLVDIAEDSQRLTGLSSISQLGSQQTFTSSQVSVYTENEKFMYKSLAKTLAEINEITKELNFVTVGTTSKIIVSPNGWYYQSCNKCTKKAEVVDQPFTCICGKYNEKSLSRYKLEIEVYYNKMTSKFVFFDRECAHVIGLTVPEVRKLTIDAGEEDIPNVYPEPLDRMLGFTLAFRVKVQPKYNNSSVMKMSEDKELIQTIKKQFTSNEGTTTQVSTDETLYDVNLIGLGDSQEVSVTEDHDPYVSSYVTPVNNHPSHMPLEQLLTPEFPSAKLSSTKLSKNIQVPCNAYLFGQCDNQSLSEASNNEWQTSSSASPGKTQSNDNKEPHQENILSQYETQSLSATPYVSNIITPAKVDTPKVAQHEDFNAASSEAQGSTPNLSNQIKRTVKS